MINAAIVGLGWWGKNIVNAVQGKSDRVRFVRGVSIEPEPVRAFAAQHGLDLSTNLTDALRDPNVQMVVLATPHSLHPSQIIGAAEAGKAVFSEKPLALNRADAISAVEACQRAGVPLGLGANKRFWPSMRELKRVVAGGELGEILHVEGHYSNQNSRPSDQGRRPPRRCRSARRHRSPVAPARPSASLKLAGGCHRQGVHREPWKRLRPV
jgi:predicted dehydrogenase